jgi:serine/threonine protein kinase
MASDIFSLGVIFCEILCGKPLNASDTVRPQLASVGDAQIMSLLSKAGFSLFTLSLSLHNAFCGLCFTCNGCARCLAQTLSSDRQLMSYSFRKSSCQCRLLSSRVPSAATIFPPLRVCFAANTRFRTLSVPTASPITSLTGPTNCCTFFV